MKDNGQATRRRIDGTEGIDFVRCRICGDHRRVISGRHLSKHVTDREAYIEEYRLSPDELIAKDFRRIQSSRRGFQPYGKTEWIAAIKKMHRRGESIFAGDLQRMHPHVYEQGRWIFGDWDSALRAAGFDPEKTRIWSFWSKESIVNELKRMRNEHLPLYAKSVMKNQTDLFKAALRHYGSWNKALLAAGVEGIPQQTRLSLLRELRDAEESGTKISKKLSLALAYYFGSLQKARLALTTDSTLLRNWNERKVIMIILQRHRSKQPLGHSRVSRESPSLVKAAERYFRSWGRALSAAGIDPRRYLHHTWRVAKRRSRTTDAVKNA